MNIPMKSLVLVLGLTVAANAWSEPSSNVVWNSETRDLLKNASPEHGKELSSTCNGCHGKDGSAELDFNFPSIAGQIAAATYKQMLDYRDNTRGHGIMQSFANTLDEKDIADLSVWYQSQALPVVKTEDTQGKEFEVTERARKLAIKGDGARLLPPCAACHGQKGEGAIVDIPALAGQNPSYFTNTMYEFKSGRRGNDLYSRMRIIAQSLSDEEIDELANYYGSIGTPEED